MIPGNPMATTLSGRLNGMSNALARSATAVISLEAKAQAFDQMAGAVDGLKTEFANFQTEVRAGITALTDELKRLTAASVSADFEEKVDRVLDWIGTETDGETPAEGQA